MIRHTSFKHGWFYHYRAHLPKVNELCEEYPELKEYIEKMFEFCPHEKFTEGPRSSALRFNLPIEEVAVPFHEVAELAKLGLVTEHYKTAHSKVQMFMLEKDNKTLAVELPIWIEAKEMPNYQNIFGSDLPLSGHIDALRIEDGKIWIWDFKPGAQKEKFATTQTFFYALMLSKRTNIPLENFMCGYFDDKNTFIFKPSEEMLKVAET